MNTKDTPFAESFGNYGDPRRYMNSQSPAKKIQAAVAKIKNSPLANLAGIMLAGSGGSSPSPIPAPALGQGVSVPAAPSIGVNANIPGAVAPRSTPMPQAAPSVMPIQDLDGDGQVDDFWGVKSSSPQSSLQNPTDFNPLAPDTSNQVTLTGNEYQQIPGFGSAQDKSGKLMKLMGMG